MVARLVCFIFIVVTLEKIKKTEAYGLDWEGRLPSLLSCPLQTLEYLEDHR
jgi:hypothetical protein